MRKMIHACSIKLKEITALAMLTRNNTDTSSLQGSEGCSDLLQSQRKQGDCYTTSLPRNDRKKNISFVFTALIACIMMCTLSACGKRSTPEPAYTPQPYEPEKPTELNQGD